MKHYIFITSYHDGAYFWAGPDIEAATWEEANDRALSLGVDVDGILRGRWEAEYNGNPVSRPVLNIQ